MSQGEVGEEEIQAALQRLLAWPDMVRSAQLAKFLDYIVTRTLRGEAHAIKAYSIAVDVFGRPADFDPQSDPIVRVQARRLRALLQHYYHGDGASEAVRIELPVGRYVPEFLSVGRGVGADAESVKPSLGRGLARFSSRWLLLALLIFCAAILAVAVSLWQMEQNGRQTRAGPITAPTVTITEFQNLTGESGGRGAGAGLAVELVTDLAQFETLGVHYGGAETTGTGQEMAYTLSGIVRREGDGLRYSAILTEAATGSVIWNRTIAVDGEALRRTDLVDLVSDELGSVLGSPRGPLHRPARVKIEQGTASAGATLYLCRLMFDLYREYATLGAGARAQQCFDGLNAETRDNAQALAAMASLANEGVAPEAQDGLSDEERSMLVEARLRRALELAPVSAFAWEQRARAYESGEQHAAAEAAYSSAQQLNPNNMDIAAARARHLAFIGRHQRAQELAREAVDLEPNPPAWYFGVPAIEALRAQEFARAARYAQTYAQADRELGPILAVMAGQGLGEGRIVNGYLPRILDLASFRAVGILTRLRQRITDETLLRDIRASLLTAGVPPTALNAAF